MPSEVFNLGRATGLSAWEVYVRQSLLLNPDIEPLSEREWLSETIGMGNSMLLKITKDNTDGVHCREFVFPENSLLGAPKTVIGSFFYGEGEVNGDSFWCKKVTDYGPEISNNQQSSPRDGSQSAHSLPSNIADVSDLVRKRMMQYVKIQDAVILQDGVWSDSNTTVPEKNFIPDITKVPTLRITFRSKVNEDFYLLLTGFINRAIIKGEVGFDMGSVIPDNPEDASAFRPENGDFLGPTLYPWANKVIFTYPGVLTSLLRSGLQTDENSKNLEIQTDEDSTDTIFKLSNIKAGLGIQVNDPSTHDNPAQEITISSRIQSSNKYIEVVKQEQFNTSDDSSKVPTTLQGSEAKPALGVGITQPSSAGQPHIIGAKIKVDSGKGSNYLGVTQSAPDDAEQAATTLSPAFGIAGPGIGLSDPELPGGGFTISSKVESSGEGSDYVGVKQVPSTNADTTTTTLTPSKAVSGKGVGITQPSTPGGKHTISAVIDTEGCGSNYLGISQPNNENRNASDVSTTLTPSKISSRKGIAITQPSTPGGDVVISSIIDVKGKASNYLKVEQEAHDSGCGCGCGDGKDADETSTVLTPSRIIEANDESRMVVDQPTTPGGDIKLSTNINFHAHKGVSIYDDPKNGVTHIGSVIAITGGGSKGMDVSQKSIEGRPINEESTIDNAATELIVSELVVDERNQKGGENQEDILTISYSSPGNPITFYVNVDEIIRRMLRSGPLNQFIQDLLDKIFGGGEFDPETGKISWPAESADFKIPIGNLNIYSNDGEGEVFEHAIRSRPGNTLNDLRLK